MNGLKALKDTCDTFVQEVKALAPMNDDAAKRENDVSARLTSAYGGIKIILSFFSEIASGKNIVDSSQTQSMTSSSDRDRDRPDYFQPGQFLVDLRMEILPMVREMWNSDFAVHSASSVIKCLVDILRSSLDGEYETGAARRSGTPPILTEVPKRTLTLNKDRVNSLVEKGFDNALAEEALYRCNNTPAAAVEYCRAQSWLRAPPRLSPPPNDVESAKPGNGASEAESAEDGSLSESARGLIENSALAMLLNQAPGRLPSGGSRNEQDQDRGSNAEVGNGTEFLANALNHILNGEHNTGEDGREESSNPHPPAGSSSERPDQPSEQRQPVRRREMTTVEDLDAEREKVRSNMVERCLDFLNVHHDVSFELADLIAAATKKHPDPESFRREVGETLVQSLVSLQMEDFQATGKKIAAYGHVLALVLQDRDMYNATLEELKQCFSTLVGFIHISSPEKSADESFPWIGHVLLILEKLLSDDCQPTQIQWNPPTGDNSNDNDEPAQLPEPLVPLDEKIHLFESLVEVLPRVGKDDALALSICRVLVILTRSRGIAARLAEKQNLQRLFVMVKQLSSHTNPKLQAAFMLTLRHIIEDEDTIRQIMRSEIVSSFESKSSQRIDTTGYVRLLYYLVLRSPELFVEVSNELLTLLRYDSHQRPQILTLKKYKHIPSSEPSTRAEDEGQSTDEAAQSKDKDKDKEKDKGKGVELKTPVVENPDGVIQYLLSELLSYKDVDDKAPSAEKPDTTLPVRSESQPDVEMTTGETSSPAPNSESQGNSRSPKKQDKAAFKADEHPIYIYRCFLLQCLTELLSSYNRTKVEFINFSRKAEQQGAAPLKPRSGILNYLLNTLLPVGTMEHDESVPFKKRSNTSAWTMRVIVALCTKTGEFGGTGRRRGEQDEEDEPDLAFVRRFVLEHALKSYKDAISSNEALDVKYARLMSLAELFDKLLTGYAFGSGDPASPSSTRHIAKTMFEKHFISTLTASLADIDLNFPMSKRVVKYILRPLNKLSQSAVMLSQTSEISNLGEADEEEFSSATSVSDMEEDREETPDLFRHSTLGMLEPRHEEGTSSGESEEEDDEIYDDDYGDEMDYDEEVPEDDGEVVSDEEDETGDAGPVEGLDGDHGMDVEVVIDEDEDGEEDDDDEDEDDNDEASDMNDDEVLAGEITGDRDNDSLGGMGEEEDDDDEWESEEVSENDEEAEMMDQFEDELAGIRQTDHPDQPQRFDDLFRALNDAAGGVDDAPPEGIAGDLPDDVDDELNEDDGTFQFPFERPAVC